MIRFSLLVLASFVSLNVLAADFEDITTTCDNLALDRTSISAECKAKNGATYKTALRLRGVNNHKGRLNVDADSSKFSEFHKTCVDTSIDADGILAGRCKDDAGRYKWSSLNVGVLIRNYNGTLVYPIE